MHFKALMGLFFAMAKRVLAKLTLVLAEILETLKKKVFYQGLLTKYYRGLNRVPNISNAKSKYP